MFEIEADSLPLVFLLLHRRPISIEVLILPPPYVAFQVIPPGLQLPIFLPKFTNKPISLILIFPFPLNTSKLNILLIKLYPPVSIKLFLLQFLNYTLNFMILNWHQFELLFIELDFGQEFVAFLSLELVVFVAGLVFAFETIVLFDCLFIAPFQLLVLTNNLINRCHLCLTFLQLNLILIKPNLTIFKLALSLLQFNLKLT